MYIHDVHIKPRLSFTSFAPKKIVRKNRAAKIKERASLGLFSPDVGLADLMSPLNDFTPPLAAIH